MISNNLPTWVPEYSDLALFETDVQTLSDVGAWLILSPVPPRRTYVHKDFFTKYAHAKRLAKLTPRRPRPRSKQPL